MSATIFEKWNSRKIQASVESPTAEFTYFLFGTSDETEARQLVEATYQSTYDFGSGFSLLFQSYDLTYLGNGNWDVTVHYSAREPRGAGVLPYPQETHVYSFEIGSQQVKRTQSIATVASYGVQSSGTGPVQSINVTSGGSGYTSAPSVSLSGGGGSGASAAATVFNGAVIRVNIVGGGSGYTSAPSVSFSGGGGSGAAATASILLTGAAAAPAPDCMGAIGVNGDAVEGVDVDTPTFTFSETWWIPKAQITLDYLKQIYQVTIAPVNDGPFRDWDEGEVRFLGATGSERDDQNFEITFRFACSPSRSDLTVNLIAPAGGVLTQTYAKEGWDYVWFRYGDFVDTLNLVKQPTAVYVEKVYDKSDFGLLEIGE